MAYSDVYYVGFDMGTNSVGWAVTSPDYRIKKFKKNAMWGVSLFDESLTAEDRRMNRTARRRNQRRKERYLLLQMLFDKEIAKVDQAFFMRLAESGLYEEDKSVEGRYSLFNDADFTDKDFYEKYKTIYHLRKSLIESDEEFDIRLVYLALNNIIQNRGHFLFDDLEAGNLPSFDDVSGEFCNVLSDHFEEIELSLNQNVANILKDKHLSKTKKQEAIRVELGVDKREKQKLELIKLLCGSKCNSDILFSNESFKDIEENKVTLDGGFDENYPKYVSAFGDLADILLSAKAIYDWALLDEICAGEKYISFARVRTYDKHKSDLKLLKSFVRKYLTDDDYCDIFRSNKEKHNNYVAYSGHTNSYDVVNASKCSQADFCAFLKKKLPKTIPENSSPEVQIMYAEIEAETFMPKIINKNNGLVPMQLNLAELNAILNNAKKYLPFLSEADENGLTVAEKIISIFKFKIPYYVGPLNNNSQKYWVVRKGGKIYPWNFESIVDIDASAEAFINNLTSKCTYLPNEFVLPKNSLLYTKYAMLNELNNLKINDEKISVELKQDIYNELLMSRNKVSMSALKSYLKSKGYKNPEISGIDNGFTNSLKVHRDFKKYFSLSESDKELAINAITIFGDDKRLLKKRLKKELGDKLSDDEIKEISRMRLSGWGRLSKRLLTGIYSANATSDTGEAENIIGLMWSTNDNFMQILFNQDYNFKQVIDEENYGLFNGSLKEEIDSLYVSPKVRRPIYQTMKIMEEITKIMKCPPKKIFVEMARGPEEKDKRKVSRRNALLAIYKKHSKEIESDVFDELSKYDDDLQFRRDKLYLYFTQMGRCMYSGERIKLSDLFNNNIYDIDHIYPQSKIKDDSLNNRVLVRKNINSQKTNQYPISSDIQSRMQSLWKSLFDKGLIEKTKYERLTRTSPLTYDELNQFVNRQLVETRQSTKAVAHMLEKFYPDTRVVFVKAGNVSKFRNEKDFVKCRALNDLHHAKDAYLNVVVGNVYDVKFSRKGFIQNLQNGIESVNRIFDYDVKGAWTVENGESIKTVRDTMRKNNIRLRRYSYKQQGQLFNVNLLKKGNGQVPIKGHGAVSDISKYGGYKSPISSYFAFVRFTNQKGESIKAFIPVDAYKEQLYLTNPEQYIAECNYPDEKTQKNNIEILIPCIKYNTLISVDGFRLNISSKNSGGKGMICKPAIPLIVSADDESYLKKISNCVSKSNEYGNNYKVTSNDGLSAEKNIEIYDMLCDKLNNSIYSVKFASTAKVLCDNKDKFINLDIVDQCNIINQILTIFSNSVASGNLEKIGGKSKSGIVTISTSITKKSKYKSFKIINQSVTGLFENEIDLLTL